MKISVNNIRFAQEHYGSDDLVADGVDALVQKIGAQLGEVEEVTDLADRFDGVVIVKVVSCVDHPNADRLHVCKIDDSGIVQNVERDENGHVQVVCGAPNVREGLLVAWLPPGSTVPDSRGKEPFVLEARELRGVMSNGMLASPKELTIGDNHDGILEIDRDVAPGTSFADAYRAKDEAIIAIENKMFTHRPDCFGTMGVIREVAGIQHKAFKSPDWYTLHPSFPGLETDELKVDVRNELPELVPRFVVMAMSGIEIKPSPVWLQVYLSEMGVRPINNVVDYTNFWMLETGQPLHAYDYDKVKDLSDGDGAVIVVRNPRDGEKLTLLNGKTIDPRQEAIMIATDKVAIGLGGVMGGGETEVDSGTTSIILECATFDMYSIRRTSMTHGLFTDAVTRFNKGQSPLQNLAVLAKVVESLRQDASAKVAGPLIDLNQLPGREWVHPPVTVTTDFINARLGLTLSAEEMKALLENVEFTVEVDDSKDGSSEIRITAPFWRTDIEMREDIVEEIGRLYGYDNLPLQLPRRSVKPVDKDVLLTLKAQIREKFVKSGANELLTYSFVHGDLLEKTGQDKAQAFQISNALSPDLQYYRLSLMPSLLEKIHPNIKAGYDQFALFEIGKVHSQELATDDEGLPTESEYTALVVAASDKLKLTDAPYYSARRYLTALVAEPLEFKPVSEDMQKFAVTKPYATQRSALVYLKTSGKFIGIIGEFRSAVTRALKLPRYCAGFELDTTALLGLQSQAESYTALPRFPKVTQDVTFRVPATLPYQELADTVTEQIETLKPAQTLVRLTPRGIYQRADDTEHKQITFRLTMASYEKTMRDTEVSGLLDAAVAATQEKLGAERV